MTNAEKIRGMTDEELCELFNPDDISCQDCPANTHCHEKYFPYNIVSVKCRDVIYEWLKQEVEDGH